MNALLAVRWLVWDTFRQARASAVFWLMLSVSAACILYCFTVAPEDVRWARVMLAAGVADTAGVLLALIWTASFLPSFLEPSSVTVLLAKPVPRWSLVAGKAAGVLLFVLFQASVFVGGTWLALGLRTGDWDGRYLLAVPVLLLHFVSFFSFSCLLATMTRSGAATIVGTLLFWLVCWAMNYGRHAHHAYVADLGPGFLRTLELGYWVLPKPADFGYLLVAALDGGAYVPIPTEVRGVAAEVAASPGATVASSLAFAAVLFRLAGYEVAQADY